MREIEGILCDLRMSKEFVDFWRSTDDIVHILKGKYGIETTKGEPNRCFAKNYNQIDLEGDFEGMFHHCHYVWNVGKKEKHEFYLFDGKKILQRVPP